ncbi:MAG TPA: DUF1572 family protein [Pedobacter sp.]|nr:DUF1572 family protein [Pedobacter sp.]
MSTSYLSSITKQFEYYKMLGERAMAQLPDEAFFWQYNEESNSIAMILQHISGNMLSRFSDFLTTDGEKPWRNRDEEFEPKILTKDELMDKWDRGWKCLLAAIDDLTAAQLEDIVYIRNEGHTVLEALNRQLAHYPYHIGQIVFVAKMVANENWKSLSIPRNKSADYNLGKFSQEKSKRHFTDNP